MNSTLMLPFVYLSAKTAYLLELNTDSSLVLTYENRENSSTKNKKLLPKCRKFCTAADQGERLHILAADEQQKLTYCILEDDQVRELPFVVKDAPGFFHLAFGKSGHGYYCGHNKNKVIIARLNASERWETAFLTLGKEPVPVDLAVDHAGNGHLLIYDPVDDILWYVTVDSKSRRFSSPLQLSENEKLEGSPCLLFDSVQNIHIAWVTAGDRQLHYRVRLAGGWPSGGWQQPKSSPVNCSPQFLSFTDIYPHPELWILDKTNNVHYYNTSDLELNRQVTLTDETTLIRAGCLTKTALQFISAEPEASFLKNASHILQEKKAAEETNIEEEEDSPIVLHARRLTGEKKRLEFELSKKEASLAQLRHMLELSQENVKRQTVLLNEKMSDINTKVSELRQKNRSLEAKCQELQGYQENDQKNRKLLQQAEAANNELRQQNTRVRADLAAALIREKEHLQMIKKLQEELSAKKGVWQTISEAFHKKPSSKK